MKVTIIFTKVTIIFTNVTIFFYKMVKIQNVTILVYPLFKHQKNTILHLLLRAEKLLSLCESEDYERYAKMGLLIEPNDPQFLKYVGEALDRKQLYTPWPDKDYSYIDFYRKSYENLTVKDANTLHQLRDAEARRDFWTGSIREIHHLIQQTPPNIQLKEARCEIYKISVSFDSSSKLL